MKPLTLWCRITHFPPPGDVLHCILPSITMRLLYAPSERHVCYTLLRGCGYAVDIYRTLGVVYAFLRPVATVYLSGIAIYRIPHLPHICLGLRFCQILQYSLRFGYIACCCICFAIIVFYRSEIYSLIFTLSSNRKLFLYIVCWSIIGSRFLFLLIRIHMVGILALLPVDLGSSQSKPTMQSVVHILCWSIIGLRCYSLLIRICIVTILTLCHGDTWPRPDNGHSISSARDAP